MKEVQIFY